MINPQELMVHELREEHRDREWVDKDGTHWMWCEDQWLVQGKRYDSLSGSDKLAWIPLDPWWWPIPHPTKENCQIRNPDQIGSRGPFMDGLYYRMTRG